MRSIISRTPSLLQQTQKCITQRATVVSGPPRVRISLAVSIYVSDNMEVSNYSKVTVNSDKTEHY